MRTKQSPKRNNYPRSFKTSAKRRSWYNKLQSRKYANPKIRQSVPGMTKKATQALQTLTFDNPRTNYPTAAYRSRPTRASVFQRPGGEYVAAQVIKNGLRSILNRRKNKYGVAIASKASSRKLPKELLQKIYSYLPR